MTNSAKRLFFAKTLLVSMTIFHTMFSAGFCILFGYIGSRAAEYTEISEWWFIIPAILMAIALLSYLETLNWHEKYYRAPRVLLKKWAGID